MICVTIRDNPLMKFPLEKNGLAEAEDITTFQHEQKINEHQVKIETLFKNE